MTNLNGNIYNWDIINNDLYFESRKKNINTHQGLKFRNITSKNSGKIVRGAYEEELENELNQADCYNEVVGGIKKW
jgi:hypothetical protein